MKKFSGNSESFMRTRIRTSSRFLLIITLCLLARPVFAVDFEGQIVEVVDGATVIFIDQLGESYKSNLFGIVAPTLGERYGEEAKQFLSNLVSGQKISGYFAMPKGQSAEDTIEEYIDFIIWDGMLNPSKEMIKAGMARWDNDLWPGHEEDLGILQTKAKEAHLGIWRTE